MCVCAYVCAPQYARVVFVQFKINNNKWQAFQEELRCSTEGVQSTVDIEHCALKSTANVLYTSFSRNYMNFILIHQDYRKTKVRQKLLYICMPKQYIIYNNMTFGKTNLHTVVLTMYQK